MKFTRLSIVLYAGLIFASGVLVGVFGQRLYTVNTVSAKASAKPDEWRKRYMHEMQSRLGLRGDQVSKLNSILDETRQRFHDVRERTKPELDAIRLEQIEKIRTMLDDRQRTEYDKMRDERERNMKKDSQRPSPGPGL